MNRRLNHYILNEPVLTTALLLLSSRQPVKKHCVKTVNGYRSLEVFNACMHVTASQTDGEYLPIPLQ